MDFLGQVTGVRQQIIKVDHILVQEHSGDAASKIFAKGSLDYRVDSISCELLPIIRHL